MVSRIKTFVFAGIKAVSVNVEVSINSGIPAFNIVGLPDKVVNESKERIRSAINSMNLSFPAKRITVNLTPADIEKEGTLLDLPIAIGILAEMGIIHQDAVDGYIAMGELSLDGHINYVNGILPAAIEISSRGLGIICPEENGPEALWAGDSIPIIAAQSLFALILHLNGKQGIASPKFKKELPKPSYLDLKDVVGQEHAKRALEIAAAGGHNLLMIGSPGTGKSMLAKRLPSILPDLTNEEILEVNMLNSVAGRIKNGELMTTRPFLDPHHSCSMAAMVGGGSKPKPGQVSLAHKGVLFLDELPEFSRQVLDSLRQPLENGEISIARANSSITFPAQFQLVAAMNPCRCGHLMDNEKKCSRAPICAKEYQSRISGPLLDRIDICIEVPRIDIFQESKRKDIVNESSADVRKRVVKAREIQMERYRDTSNRSMLNANASNDLLREFTKLSCDTEEILEKAVNSYGLSMRGYTKILKVARTIADLEGNVDISKGNILEALRYKRANSMV